MSFPQTSNYPSCQKCPDLCFPHDIYQQFHPKSRRFLPMDVLDLDWLPIGSNCSHHQGVDPPDESLSQRNTPRKPPLSIASPLVVWEGCNLLAQRRDIPWSWDGSRWTYRKPVKRGRGELQFWIEGDNPQSKSHSDIAEFDIRSACLHLIYAAKVTQLSDPTQGIFQVSDRDLAHYFGLQRRRDLSQHDKLNLLERLVREVSRLRVAIRWLQQGDIPAFEEPEHPLWELVQFDHHPPQRSQRHPSGFTLAIRPGPWVQHFLNPQGQQQGRGFYQTTNIEADWIELAFRNWQQHPGMVRSLFWLIFKLRFGRQSPLRVSTFMTIAYGRAKLERAEGDRDTRKRLIRTFERDLELLAEAGLMPEFDSKTYPLEIRPLWARLQAIPDDPDDPTGIWLSDGEGDRSLLDFAPRGKWKRLKKARFCGFEPRK
ncbi:MAG: hypothetical protein JJU32_16225 [Phormidium sp. BM_Day4_Bin.17]|nr:hypothetical protein [Phormidium sp. BM_Day4_Bin.17]UCJ11100.1 MAG: hypothetical protein JWS08_15005 [Phormidium sp. PBR-2020]